MAKLRSYKAISSMCDDDDDDDCDSVLSHIDTVKC